MVQALPCPTCGRSTPVSSASHLPFCSERCRLIDLGRWLDEENALPAADDDSDEPVQNSADADSRPAIQLPPGWHDA